MSDMTLERENGVAIDGKIISNRLNDVDYLGRD